MKRRINFVCEALCLCALLFLWVYALFAYAGLPDVIPVHFGADGRADRFGNKNAVWMLPFLGLVIYAGGLVLRTRACSLPKKQSSEGPLPHQQQLTNRLFQTLSLVILLFLSFLNFRFIQSSPRLDGWFLPLFFFALLSPTAVFVYQSLRR